MIPPPSSDLLTDGHVALAFDAEEARDARRRVLEDLCGPDGDPARRKDAAKALVHAVAAGIALGSATTGDVFLFLALAFAEGVEEGRRLAREAAGPVQ
jgi:hypothetical protein